MQVNRWQKLNWTIPVVLIFATIIDATLPAIFPNAFLNNYEIVVSHICLYFIVLFALYFRDSHILVNSFLIGLFYDSYNTTLLGLYALLYFLVAYGVVKMRRNLPKNGIIHFMLFIIAITFVDVLVYFFYVQIGLVDLSPLYFIVSRLAPTLIYNLVIGAILYLPSNALMSWLGYEDYIVF